MGDKIIFPVSYSTPDATAVAGLVFLNYMDLGMCVVSPTHGQFYRKAPAKRGGEATGLEEG
jgi:hypothetical protein